MNETGKSFSPAELIAQHLAKREQKFLETSTEPTVDAKKMIEEAVLPALVKKIVETKAAVRTRTVRVNEEKEGRSGHTPRSEKIKAAREMLRGLRLTRTRVEDVEREFEVEEESSVDEVSMKFMVDATPNMLHNGKQIRATLDFLVALNSISPADLNEKQDETVIKKVTKKFDVLLTTVDGHRVLHLRNNMSNEELIESYVDALKQTVVAFDPSDNPRLSYSGKLIDIYDETVQHYIAERKRPHVVYHHALVLDKSSYMKGVQLRTQQSYVIHLF